MILRVCLCILHVSSLILLMSYTGLRLGAIQSTHMVAAVYVVFFSLFYVSLHHIC